MPNMAYPRFARVPRTDACVGVKRSTFTNNIASDLYDMSTCGCVSGRFGVGSSTGGT